MGCDGNCWKYLSISLRYRSRLLVNPIELNYISIFLNKLYWKNWQLFSKDEIVSVILLISIIIISVMKFSFQSPLSFMSWYVIMKNTREGRRRRLRVRAQHHFISILCSSFFSVFTRKKYLYFNYFNAFSRSALILKFKFHSKLVVAKKARVQIFAVKQQPVEF